MKLKHILISTVAASVVLLAGCSIQTADTNSVSKANSTNENVTVEVVANTNGTVSNKNTNDTTVNGDIDISDWLTYTNEEYGFGFRYPKDWLLNDNGSSISLRTDEVKNIAYTNAMTISIINKQYETIKNEIENSDRIDDGTSLAQFSDDILIEDMDGASAMKGIHATAFGPFMQYYYIPLTNSVALYIEYFEATDEINTLIEPVINTLQII